MGFRESTQDMQVIPELFKCCPIGHNISLTDWVRTINFIDDSIDHVLHRTEDCSHMVNGTVHVVNKVEQASRTRATGPLREIKKGMLLQITNTMESSLATKGTGHKQGSTVFVDFISPIVPITALYFPCIFLILGNQSEMTTYIL